MRGIPMEMVATVDERGRLLIPGEIRRRIGLSGKTRVLVRVREDKVLEIVPLNVLLEDVRKLFDEKFRDWREEDHEASKLLQEMVK